MTVYLTHTAARIVYVRTPKCAGVTIYDGVFKRGCEDQADNFFPAAWRWFPSFAVVRHPFERFCSAYRMFVQGPMQFKGTPIEFFDIAAASRLAVSSIEPPSNDPAYWERAIAYHVAPQSHPVNCLDVTKTLIRFETLERDLRRYLSLHGMNVGRLPKLNVTAPITPPWHHYMTASDGLEARLFEFYAEDFRRFPHYAT